MGKGQGQRSRTSHVETEARRSRRNMWGMLEAMRAAATREELYELVDEACQRLLDTSVEGQYAFEATITVFLGLWQHQTHQGVKVDDVVMSKQQTGGCDARRAASARRSRGRIPRRATLISYTSDPSAKVRTAAIKSFVRLPGEAVPVDTLTKIALDADENRDVRLAAVFELGRTRQRAAFESLVSLIDSPDEFFAYSVASALGRLAASFENDDCAELRSIAFGLTAPTVRFLSTRAARSFWSWGKATSAPTSATYCSPT